MKIKPMLLRLQAALGYDDSAQPAILSSGNQGIDTDYSETSETINLVVGYNGSPNSLTALDLTLWIAYQTRLATQRAVMVHVVYVIQGKEFEQADRVLYQARYLAEEWRGSLTTHLQFGSVADGIREVVRAENAELLLLGCRSQRHALVKRLGDNLPCPVLGIPQSSNKVQSATAVV